MLGRLSAVMLQLSAEAFFERYKVPKQRDDKIRQLVERRRGLWNLGRVQLRRRLAEQGVAPDDVPTSKAELVDAHWARTVACHYALLAAAGSPPLPVAELARALGLEVPRRFSEARRPRRRRRRRRRRRTAAAAATAVRSARPRGSGS